MHMHGNSGGPKPKPTPPMQNQPQNSHPPAQPMQTQKLHGSQQKEPANNNTKRQHKNETLEIAEQAAGKHRRHGRELQQRHGQANPEYPQHKQADA